MKTEIQGDFIGYLLRFKMPSRSCLLIPLKSACFIFIFELILSSILIFTRIGTWSVVLSLIVSMMAVGYYVGVLYKDFWNVVLVESKGFFADIIMWLYYVAICALSLSPAFILFYLSEV